jgi:flagellar basal body-associated protein FliL
MGMNKKIVLKFIYDLISYKTFCFFEGLADNSSDSKNENKDVSEHVSSGSSAGLKILIVFLGVVAVIAFSVFLFKLWQRKKREEQHARLLKLFEDDDELEVELGMRD